MNMVLFGLQPEVFSGLEVLGHRARKMWRLFRSSRCQNVCAYRGTSLIRKGLPLRLYRRPIARALWCPRSWGAFSYVRDPPVGRKLGTDGLEHGGSGRQVDP